MGSVQSYSSSKNNRESWHVQLQPKDEEIFFPPSRWRKSGWEMEGESPKGGQEHLEYLVSCLKQYTQKRCPHCAWKGFLRTSLHFWHWYLCSMDTDRTCRDIPGKVESIDEGKDGRAIPFHLSSMLIIFEKEKTGTIQMSDFLAYFRIQN